MKSAQNNKHYNLISAIIIPPFLILVNWLLFGKRYFTEWKVFLLATIVIIGFEFVCHFAINFCVVRIRKSMPHYLHAVRRAVLLVCISFGISACVTTFFYWLYDYYSFLGYEFNMANYRWTLLASLILSIIITFLNEGADAVEQWKKTIQETEQLKKSTLQKQLEGLKEQVNPHFLFNGLNSLSLLIGEDPHKASRFLDELSKVYRYLLRNNEERLTPLYKEIQFIRSYFHLLQIRYNDAIILKVDAHVIYMNYLVAPLTLQLLVENAVKHNIILKEQPLTITISADEEKLTVSNNLQEKNLKIQSSVFGLNNLVDKYKLLNQGEVAIQRTETEFKVIIPLIKSQYEAVQAG